MKRYVVVTPCSDGELIAACLRETGGEVVLISERDSLDLPSGPEPFDILFLDLSFLGRLNQEGEARDYRATLKRIEEQAPFLDLVILAQPESVREAVLAVRAGATDFLTYPVAPEAVRLIQDEIYESQRLQSTLKHLQSWQWDKSARQIVKTRSPLMQDVFEKVATVAPTLTTVLLTGETGVGKGVIAKLIHQHSSRRGSQFISVHCGAIPDTLIESELFGHEKGAFTGADKRRLGKFEVAAGGTIFLDEIATITPATQIKLLQVLQDRSFQRVGGESSIKADVRIIAATNMDLKVMVESGQFRSDLFYRLFVFPIEIPPLRQRLEDIPHLVNIFLERLNQLNTKDVHGVRAGVLSVLQKYHWPGNIRELENLVERAYILEPSDRLTSYGFPQELFQTPEEPLAQARPNTGATLAEARNLAVEAFERDYLEALMTENKGRMDQAAEQAGVSSRQLRNLLHKYELRKESYKAKTNEPG